VSQTPTEAQASGFFVAVDPDGKKYVGLNIVLPMISMQVIIAGKDEAPATLKAFREAVNEVIGKPRLSVVHDPRVINQIGGGKDGA